jgi:hypothetical protein
MQTYSNDALDRLALAILERSIRDLAAQGKCNQMLRRKARAYLRGAGRLHLDAAGICLEDVEKLAAGGTAMSRAQAMSRGQGATT